MGEQMRPVSQADTYMHFVGSMAVAHAWYVDVAMTPDDFTLPGAAYVDWSLAWTDSETGKRYTVRHTEIMRAVRTFIGSQPPKHASRDAIEECRNLVFRPDEVDFDANTADEILQCTAFGEVVYG